MANFEGKGKRMNWRYDEIECMLWIIQEKHVLDILDGKRKRNKDVFQAIDEELKKKNIFKTGAQIRAKFKALKREYYGVKRNNLTSGAERKTCQFYNILDEILSNRPVSSVSGVDTSDIAFDTADLELPNSSLSLIISNETTSYNKADQNSDIGNVQVQPVEKPTKSPKKKSYQKSVNTFMEEWKLTQEKLVESLNKQNENFLEEMRNQARKEEEMLKQDREESQNFMHDMMQKFFGNNQPQQQFYPSNYELMNRFMMSGIQSTMSDNRNLVSIPLLSSSSSASTSSDNNYASPSKTIKESAMDI